MANVETEQNKTLAPQQGVGDQSASINLHEENLEALLNALSNAGAPSPTPRVATLAPPQPAVRVATPVDPLFTATAPVEAAFTSVVAALAEATSPELQTQPHVDGQKEPAVAPPAEEAKPFVASIAPPPPLQIPPAIALQQDMTSKLALLSSIKQRRAITVRPDMIEAPVSAVETSPAVQTEKPVASEQIVLRTPEPAKEIPPTPTLRASAPQDVRVEGKTTLPAKKVWTNSSTARPDEASTAEAPREQKLRREERSKPEPRQEKLTEEAPRAEAKPRREAVQKLSVLTDLPAFGSSALSQELPTLESLESGDSANAPNFLTSKAGMGAMGGGLAVAALAAYFLIGHGSKPANAGNAGATESAQTVNVAPVASTVASEKSSDKPSSSVAANPRATAPSATSSAPNPGGPPSFPTPQPLAAVQQKPGTVPTSTAIPQVPQQVPPTQPAVVETPKTTARKFAAPAPAARPANATIIDAPPALTPTSTAPGVVALPTRIAPLPPPPAARAGAAPAPTPAQAAAASGQPGQITVPGKTQAARLARQVLPVYPQLAKTARVQGTVRFRVTVGADGAVKALTSLGGPLPLVQAATDAVKQWRYQPTMVEGKPVEVVTEIDVNFSL